MDPRQRFYLLLLAALACLTGCATTTMKTTERLGSGQVVVGGGFDVFPIPTRVHGHLVVGAGDVADVGFHAGLGLPTNFGASMRLYLGPWVDLTTEADLFLFSFDGPSCMLLLIIPLCGPNLDEDARFRLSGRLTTALRELKDPKQAGTYGGLIASATTESLGGTRGHQRNPFDGGSVGIVFGVESRRMKGVNFQTEMALVASCNEWADCWPAAQISFGWNYGGHRRKVQRQKAPNRDPYRDRRRPERW